MSRQDPSIPETVLATVKSPGNDAPSLESAAEQLGVHVEHIDARFGVVPIDPSQGLYCVQVLREHLPVGSEHTPYRGPYANPEIRPFAPIDTPKKGPKR
jgi:hypothetical protein